MADLAFESEAQIYDVMSKLASRAALSAAVQTIALIQKEMSENPKNGHIQALAGAGVLNESEQAVLTSYEPDVLNRAWRKVIRTIDMGISFVPELDRLPRTEALLIRPGDKVGGLNAQGFPGVLANWEVEVDLGIIRGKVSW